jgi:PAS domain S-box-containing protein
VSLDDGEPFAAPDHGRQWAVAALGALLSAAAAAHFVDHTGHADPMVTAATVGPAVAVLAYGLWFWLFDTDAPRGDAVFTWAVGGAGLVLALDLWAVYADAYGNIATTHVFVQHSSVGAFGGAVAGTYAERDRWRARSRLRLLETLDSAMDGIAVLDDDRVIQYANASFASAFGVEDPQAVVGQSWQCSYPPATQERVAEVLADLDAAGDGWQETVTASRADGSTYPQELSMTAVEDGFVWVCRDVTGREERDQRLRVLNRVLRHDTRNALNVVLGRTDRLADRLGGDDEDVAAILAAAENLLETSEKARKLEDALERDAADDVAVDELVGAQVAAVREDHPDADFEVSVTCDARVDERLRLAVRELLENSVEHASASDEGPAHSSQDGEAGVQTGDTDDTGDTPEVKVSVTPDPLSVRVSDDGPGVPEHERRALSGVEETALQHGSGLGLWLVYWAVRQTGGVVEATDDGAVVVWPAGKN